MSQEKEIELTWEELREQIHELKDGVVLCVKVKKEGNK